MVIGNRCCFRSSRVTARYANKGYTAIKRCCAAAGPVARCVTNSCIIVVWRAANSHSSRPGHASVRPVVGLRPTRRLPRPTKTTLPSPSARDVRFADRSSPDCSPSAPDLCVQRAICPGAGDPRAQRILHGQFLHQRPIQLATNESDHGPDADPPRPRV